MHTRNLHIPEWQRTLLILKVKTSSQEVKVATSLKKLKENETALEKKPCKCKRFCKIMHFRHNWNLKASSSFSTKFGKIQENSKFHPCTFCEKSFDSFSEHKDHVGLYHGQNREDESGGS